MTMTDHLEVLRKAQAAASKEVQHELFTSKSEDD